MKGMVATICIGLKRGQPKVKVPAADIQAGYGIEGDSHAGTSRPISLLSLEQIAQANADNDSQFDPCGLGENITVSGLSLDTVANGDIIRAGTAVLQVVAVGKQLDNLDYNGFPEVTILAKVGVFCKAVESGRIRVGDKVEIAKQMHTMPL